MTPDDRLAAVERKLLVVLWLAGVNIALLALALGLTCVILDRLPQ